MPRPSVAQVCLGSFTVVATTVVLLAVSGASGVLAVAVLVGFALVLGTVVTVLSMSAATARAATAGAATVEDATVEAGAADPARAPRPAAAATGHAYARQR
ncbi:hypothetical protein ACFVVA_35660 [Kitasatospora sp. NPDC058048]|uniref:hypothetical protein n=1 Tax=Kitasatospora sp. NPDC058048 TaxID=3346313 RepID=UPI0036DB287E